MRKPGRNHTPPDNLEQLQTACRFFEKNRMSRFLRGKTNFDAAAQRTPTSRTTSFRIFWETNSLKWRIISFFLRNSFTIPAKLFQFASCRLEGNPTPHGVGLGRARESRPAVRPRATFSASGQVKNLSRPRPFKAI
jgi:hypothetical protein